MHTNILNTCPRCTAILLLLFLFQLEWLSEKHVVGRSGPYLFSHSLLKPILLRIPVVLDLRIGGSLFIPLLLLQLDGAIISQPLADVSHKPT